MPQHIDIVELSEEDLPDVGVFLQREAGQFGPEGERVGAVVDHLRWFLFENPARRADIPLGWVARDAQKHVVGVKLCAPQNFSCRGERYRMLMGGAFFVAESHRGIGLTLFQKYLAQGAQHALYTTTANDLSGAIYDRFGAYPIPNTDHEFLGIIRWGPLVEEWLHRRVGRPGLARAVSKVAGLRPSALKRRHSGGELVPIQSAAELERVSVETPPELREQITAVRDTTFLKWRYFEGPDDTRTLWVFQGHAGVTCLIAVNRRRRGYRQQVRSLNVLDLWGALPDSAVADITGQLVSRYGDEIDMIVVRGQPADRQPALRDAGFIFRKFSRPIGVCIDRAGILPTRDWYLVPADGDMGH